MPAGSPLRLVDGLAGAGAELRSHGYDWARVRERTGLRWQVPFPAAQLDEVDTQLLPDDDRPPVDWLIRLFLLGDPIASGQLDAFLGARSRTVLVAAGLLREREGEVIAEVMLLPFEDLLLACDWPWRELPDRVIVPDPSSALTAEHVAPLPGEPAGTALDVGTGCGIIALVAARHFARVTGVDISPRAVAFARFNAALNERDVTFEECDAAFVEHGPIEPVDLLSFVLPVLFPGLWRREASAHVSQVAPGVDGKDLALGVYRGLPRALAPGGRALLFHQVPLAADDDLAVWLREAGVAGALDTVANLVHTGDARFAYARVSAHRTAPPGRLRQVRGPNHLFGAAQTRTDLARHLTTAARLDEPLAAAVPRIHDWVGASTAAAVAAGALGAPRAALDEVGIEPDAWVLVQAIDGRATVGELQRRRPELAVEALTRELARQGFVHLSWA